MAKQILTPLVLVPTGSNVSGLQLNKLPAGGAITQGAYTLGVDASGNVVLAPPPTPTVLSLDMGSLPTPAKTFSVTVSNVAATSKIVCSLSGDQPNGAGIDEYELEPLIVYGRVAAANTLEFTITCANDYGLTNGVKYVNYYVG